MYKYLLPLFFIIPLLEVWLLISVGQQIGAVLTIAAVVGTAVAGIYWLRIQGIGTLLRLQERLRYREPPTVELVEGGLLVLAGAFLLTPGFATDAIGFVLLITASRRSVAKLILARFVGKTTQAGSRQGTAGQYGAKDSANAAPQPVDPVVIEGEYTREPDD